MNCVFQAQPGPLRKVLGGRSEKVCLPCRVKSTRGDLPVGQLPPYTASTSTVGLADDLGDFMESAADLRGRYQTVSISGTSFLTA